jgi:hypothetical protein
VAARQALVDVATSTGLARDPNAAALLHTLDRALTAK